MTERKEPLIRDWPEDAVAAGDAVRLREFVKEKEGIEVWEKRRVEAADRLAAEEAARAGVAKETGITEPEVLRALVAAGYTPDTVQVLHLVPLLELAWAEGGVSDHEQALIREAARLRGVEEGSAAGRQLDAWLATHPSDFVFESSLRAIGLIIDCVPAEQRDAARADLVDRCAAVASASGGFLGLGTVSGAERRLLQQISDTVKARRG